MKATAIAVAIIFKIFSNPFKGKLLDCPYGSSSSHTSTRYSIRLTVGDIIHKCLCSLWEVIAVLSDKTISLTCEGRILTLSLHKIVYGNPVMSPLFDFIS